MIFVSGCCIERFFFVKLSRAENKPSGTRYTLSYGNTLLQYLGRMGFHIIWGKSKSQSHNKHYKLLMCTQNYETNSELHTTTLKKF